MQIIKTKKITKVEILKAAEIIKKGGVVLIPTDTIYGLSALATDKKAIKKVFAIKKRDPKFGFIILVNDIKMAEKYVILRGGEKNELKKIWKKKRPTTVILKSRNILPGVIEGKTGNLAIRIPKKKFLLDLIKIVDAPIISTSANLSGEKNLESLEKINYYFFRNKPDLVIDVGIVKSKSSKIVDLTDVENIKIIRG